ncbi:MAG: KGGVGR-motif variant AAA ATPase [Halorhodospira sp.]
MTFDEVLPKVREVLASRDGLLEELDWMVVNRDLNGRISLVVPDAASADEHLQGQLGELASTLEGELGPHGLAADRAVLYEEDRRPVLANAPNYPLDEEWDHVTVVDRLVTEGWWGAVEPATESAKRVVFYSIKGGVGRSTALAVSAWWLAQAESRVLVLDMDLESPGLSSTLLPEERRPAYGIADWLVEDLVGNGDAVLDDMVATSELSREGEILVVPSHGQDPGDYVAKLGRAWMPSRSQGEVHQAWHQRLDRMIAELESQWRPDVILIDSRSGIDDIASACVTDLKAGLVLLFAHDDAQTWTGYSLLLRYWTRTQVIRDMRERLQVIGATLPDVDTETRFDELRERAWDLFSEYLYDEIPAGAQEEACWNFDDRDEGAPHYPWAVRWHRDFTALTSLHDRLEGIDSGQVRQLFGPLVEGIERYVSARSTADE